MVLNALEHWINLAAKSFSSLTRKSILVLFKNQKHNAYINFQEHHSAVRGMAEIVFNDFKASRTTESKTCHRQLTMTAMQVQKAMLDNVLQLNSHFKSCYFILCL